MADITSKLNNIIIDKITDNNINNKINKKNNKIIVSTSLYNSDIIRSTLKFKQRIKERKNEYTYNDYMTMSTIESLRNENKKLLLYIEKLKTEIKQYK